MYRKQRRRKHLLPILVVLLCSATFGTSLAATPAFSLANSAAFFAGILCTPGAALAAARDYVADTAAVPVAQTVDEDDYTSGFWTTLPTEEEIHSEQASSESTQTPESTPKQEKPESIPEGSVPIIEATYGLGNGAGYIQSGAGSIRNATALSDSEVAAEVAQALPFAIELNSSQPQVLIMHTHATETYETTNLYFTDPDFSARSTDTSRNVVAVGAEIAAQLNAAGINTVQSTILHDYPSYTGSYAKSHETVQSYLAQYPSIKVVLDVHRDAIQQTDGTRMKPIAEIDGKTAAQVMIICGADLNGNLPNFKQNLRFAARFTDAMESAYPGLTRPVLFDYRYYNQDLTTGSLLVEMGGHANTLEEAMYSATLVGKSLASLFTAG